MFELIWLFGIWLALLATLKPSASTSPADTRRKDNSRFFSASSGCHFTPAQPRQSARTAEAHPHQTRHMTTASRQCNRHF